MSRRYLVNRSDFESAKKIRENFTDRKMRQQVPIHWDWPDKLYCIGQSEAVQYTSDKWQQRGDYKDYKHVAEGPQLLYVREGFVRDWWNTSRELDFPCEEIELRERMPDVIAELAPILGLQFQPYREPKDDHEPLKLSGQYYNIDIARAKVGAAELSSGEIFLIVYTSTDLCGIITGDILSVERDGIVGN